MKTFAGLSIVASALSEDARESPRLARELGVTGIVFDAAGSTDLTSLSGTGRREFRSLLDRNGQTLVALRSDIGGRGLAQGVDVDRLIAQLDRALESARALMCPLVCVDLGALPAPVEEVLPPVPITPERAGVIIIPTLDAPKAPPPQTPPPDPALVAHVDSALSAIGELAERYSVHVALSSSLAGFGALHRAIQSVRCPWFAIDLDPSAILRDRWNIDETFSRLGNLMLHVSARDAALGADRRTRPAILGQGDVNWREVFDALESSNYHGWLTIDPMQLNAPRAGAVRGLEYVRSL